MEKVIIGKKLGMTQIFNEEGKLVPVTVVEAGPCKVVQVKNETTDGYNGIQLGYGKVKEKKVTKPLKGHFDKNEIEYTKMLKEFRVADADAFSVGQDITVSVFENGDQIDISGISKGKGFAGVIKRHNQTRGPMSHGSKYHRGVGSLGASSSPSRVFKGKKLPGQMGNVNVTVQNLQIVKVDADRNLLLIKGAVPGIRGSVVTIKETVKK